MFEFGSISSEKFDRISYTIKCESRIRIKVLRLITCRGQLQPIFISLASGKGALIYLVQECRINMQFSQLANLIETLVQFVRSIRSISHLFWRLAEIHEERPSVIKMDKFTETIGGEITPESWGGHFPQPRTQY